MKLSLFVYVPTGRDEMAARASTHRTKTTTSVITHNKVDVLNPMTPVCLDYKKPLNTYALSVHLVGKYYISKYYCKSQSVCRDQCVHCVS